MSDTLSSATSGSILRPTSSQTVEEPIDLIRLSLDEYVTVKCKGGRVLYGRLHAYDQHLNLVLGGCDEVYTYVELSEETGEELIQTNKRNIPLLFVRGDSVILVSPPIKTT
jgi:U6 snRNA-associated Sm-like protein LSm3